MKRLLHFYLRAIALVLLLSISSLGDCMAGNRFKIVKSTSEIKDGDIVIVAKAANDAVTKSAVLSTDVNIDDKKVNSVIYGDSIKIENGIALETVKTQRFRLDNVSGNTYRLYSLSKDMYLCNNCTGNNGNKSAYRTTGDSAFKGTSKVTISFDEKGNVKLYYEAGKDGKTSYENRCLYYSGDKSSGYFNMYRVDYWQSENRCVQLYKLIEGEETSDEVALDEAVDNSSVITANTGSPVNVTLSRTLVADKWNTFCVPFDVALTDNGKKLNGVGVAVMEYADMMGNIMMFTQVTEKIEAGKAYLIKPEANISNPRFENVSVVDKTPIISGEEFGYSFRGVYSPKQFSAEERTKALIVTGDASLKRPEEDGKMKGMRAYFITPAEVSADNSPKLMVGGQVTGISDIVFDEPADAAVYGLDGIAVGSGKRQQKGIYIKNGKKYLAR